MYSSIEGVLTSFLDESFEIKTKNGVGYEVFSLHKYDLKLNKEYKFYIFDIFKENRVFLYGFLEINEKRFFEKLLEINGIGPKRALAILSSSSINELILMIKSKNAKDLAKIKGVGRFSEQIIYSLFNKLNDFDPSIFKYQNVYLALTNLGYSGNIVSEVLYSIDQNLEDERALKEAIRRLNNA